MKMRLSLFSWVVILFFACSKGGDEGSPVGGGGGHVITPNDTTRPDLTIYTPTANQVFSSGNVISVTGKVTDDLGLYQGSIKMVNDATGAAVVSQPYVIHGILSYNFNISQSISVVAPTDYTITVTFEDHGSNSISRSVKVKVLP